MFSLFLFLSKGAEYTYDHREQIGQGVQTGAKYGQAGAQYTYEHRAQIGQGVKTGAEYTQKVKKTVFLIYFPLPSS